MVNTMILRLFRRQQAQRNIAPLYGAIVAQARHPAFYTGYGVPDTLNGRLDLLLLHLVVVTLHLGPQRQPLGQQLFDRFCQDMDDNLREMGVGDLAVPKEMKRIGEAFYGRLAAYEAALKGDDAELAATLARNVYAVPTDPHADRLARYVRELAHGLAAQPEGPVDTARFPDPAKIPAHKGA